MIDRADDWRARAVELRAVAEGMRETVARSALEAEAASLEEHATKLEYVTVKFCRMKRSRVSIAAKTAA